MTHFEIQAFNYAGDAVLTAEVTYIADAIHLVRSIMNMYNQIHLCDATTGELLVCALCGEITYTIFTL